MVFQAAERGLHIHRRADWVAVLEHEDWLDEGVEDSLRSASMGNNRNSVFAGRSFPRMDCSFQPDHRRNRTDGVQLGHIVDGDRD